MGFLSGISCLFCNSLNGCMKVSLLPIVEMWEGWNSLSVNLHNKQVFPTPESPRSKSLNSTSYCLAMVSYGHNSRNSASGFHVYPLHSIIFSPFPSTAPRLRVDRPNNCPDKTRCDVCRNDSGTLIWWVRWAGVGSLFVSLTSITPHEMGGDYRVKASRLWN